MAVLDERVPVGELVVERPARSRILEDFGIDYCCGGKLALSEACARRGVDPERVLQAIRRQDGLRGDPRDQHDWANASLLELCGHIESTHHAGLRRELPRIESLLQRVVQAHGERHPELRETAEVFLAFSEELREHMRKEERILFPLIRELESGEEQVFFPCGSLADPVRAMEHEHDRAGDALRRLRTLTAGYTPPADACNTWRVLLDALRELEADMHIHVHEENNILFPRALELASAR